MGRLLSDEPEEADETSLGAEGITTELFTLVIERNTRLARDSVLKSWIDFATGELRELAINM